MENRPPASSAESNTSEAASSPLTVGQHQQLLAQTLVRADLVNGNPPKEEYMVWAFGQPAKGHKHAWEDAWRAAVDRWQQQMSPCTTGLETPDSVRIDNCATERCSKDTAVCKTMVSEPHSRENRPNSLQHDLGQEASQVGGFEHAREDICCGAGDRLPNPTSPMAGLETPANSRIDSCMTGQGRKDTAVCKTMVSEPHSRKNRPNSLQHDGDQEATQGERYSSHHEPVGGCEHAREDICCAAVDRLPNPTSPMARLETPTSSWIDSCTTGQGRKDTAVCKTMVSEPRTGSLSKKKTGKKIKDIQKTCPNSPRDGNEDGAKRSLKKNIPGNTATGTSHVHRSDDGFCGLRSSTQDKHINSLVEDLTEQETCAICRKDGQLQKCSGCFLAVHLSCFAPAVRFNDCGGCPVCFYNEATEALKKAQKKHSEASENLSAFFGAKQLAKRHSEQFAKRHSEQSAERQQRAANGAVDLNGCGTSRRKPDQQSEAANRKVRFQEKGAVNSYRKSLGCQDQLMPSPSRRRSYAYPPEHHSNPHTPARTPMASSSRMPFASTARRTRVIWTEAEEAALREAVAKFAPKDKRQISWIQIHEYGRGVFHQARRPDDLMRKWDYMRKNEALKKAGFRV